MNRMILLTLALFTFAFSCNKKEKGDLRLEITHNVDGAAFLWDSTAYTTPAGYPYNISNLEYYISNIEVVGAGGTIYTSNDVYYINPDDPSTLTITLPDVEFGHIMSVRCLVGLDEDMNRTGKLPNTSENSNMAWPEVMGGGYHFLKFEGHYLDTMGLSRGYAIHLGENGNTSQNVREFHVEFSESGKQLEMSMNLNEWFRTPHIYDFETDGASSMYLPEAMLKLAENGVDVFAN